MHHGPSRVEGEADHHCIGHSHHGNESRRSSESAIYSIGSMHLIAFGIVGILFVLAMLFRPTRT